MHFLLMTLEGIVKGDILSFPPVDEIAKVKKKANCIRSEKGSIIGFEGGQGLDEEERLENLHDFSIVESRGRSLRQDYFYNRQCDFKDREPQCLISKYMSVRKERKTKYREI